MARKYARPPSGMEHAFDPGDEAGVDRRRVVGEWTMLTADTITDEQLRELQQSAHAAKEWLLIGDCKRALGEAHERESTVDYVSQSAVESRRRDARARCAEILNARTRKETK